MQVHCMISAVLQASTASMPDLKSDEASMTHLRNMLWRNGLLMLLLADNRCTVAVSGLPNSFDTTLRYYTHKGLKQLRLRLSEYPEQSHAVLNNIGSPNHSHQSPKACGIAHQTFRADVGACWPAMTLRLSECMSSDLHNSAHTSANYT